MTGRIITFTAIVLMGLSGLVACSGNDGGGTSSTDSEAQDAISEMDSGADSTIDAEPMPAPSLSVDKRALTLVGAAGAASEPGVLTLTNEGDAPLNIEEVRLEPEDVAIHFAVAGADTFPIVIEPGADLQLELTYTAPDVNTREATLVIVSNNPRAPEYTVGITGRVGESCIRTMPSAVDLGSVDAGVRSGQFEFRIINCGDTTRTVSAVQLDGSEDFLWSTRSGNDVSGLALERGDSLAISVTYVNQNLIPDEVETARLIIAFREADSEAISVPIRVRGGSGQRCLVRADLDNLDFEIVRIDEERTLNVTVTNFGTGPCELREITLRQTAGDEANPFVLTQNTELNTMPAMTSRTLGVTYRPTLQNPVGERGVLTVSYFDEFANMNRAAEVLLRGTGSRALAGSVPEVIDFDETTNERCASRQLRIGAENVGFVPICALSYAVSGDDCDQFQLLETPDFGDCLSLERGEAASFLVQFEPSALGRQSCNIDVTTDAQNQAVTSLSITGTGVETDARQDQHEVGRLNPERDAVWSLRLAAVADSVQVFVDDEAYNRIVPLMECAANCFEYDAENNRIVIEPDFHPARGAALRIEYNAQCFDRLGN